MVLTTCLNVSRVQALIGTDSIPNLHKLEQVSSDEGIGTLAENLLEALREHAEVNLKIDAARRETRAEKKRMAMAMRQKALGTLGMTVLEPMVLLSAHLLSVPTILSSMLCLYLQLFFFLHPLLPSLLLRFLS